MATVTPGTTFSSNDVVTPAKLNLAATPTISNIVNADISASAAIALSKLATIPAGQVLLGNASNVPTATALSGDVTISNTGVTTIGAVVDNANIATGAAIAHNKLANITAGQVLLGNASNVPTATALSGDVTISNTGVTTIGAGTIETGMLANDAVTADKLADHATTDASRAVTTNHIRDLAVTTAKLADDAVTADKLADHATTDASRAVTTNHIRDGAVTNSKLRNSAALSVIGNSTNASADPADIAAATDGHVLRRSGTVLGFGQVATAGIADDAVNNDKLSLAANASEIKKALNADNSPPIFACRAWVNFDGSSGSTVDEEFRCTIRASGNVSKVVRAATGTFVVHFSTAMPDNDYCVFAMANESVLGNRSSGINIRGTDDSLMSTTSVTLDTGSASSGGAANISVNSIAIFR